ncbi:hypothetical protein NDU88_000092 [Pleurodeles waltl]|uniref:Uncharacterized protein n=1 Tax=Pleurodeles waltl TaxID=8319 RepID=A0AAV7S5Z5_PLEWA|nr:hypothetical protein NDU88_000092 [Pleurodeles waltl]
MFYTRLHKLASTCTGLNQHEKTRAQIIQGCRSYLLRKLILWQPGISLDEILILARSHESINRRADDMVVALVRSTTVPGLTKLTPMKEEQVDAILGRQIPCNHLVPKDWMRIGSTSKSMEARFHIC